MAAVNMLKRQLEAAQPNREDGESNDASPPSHLLEVFCVDCSISMARSQTFPFFLGESKLSNCRRIILQGFTLPQNCTLHTALVKFHSAPHLAVPFAMHSPEQARFPSSSLTLQAPHRHSCPFTFSSLSLSLSFF